MRELNCSPYNVDRGKSHGRDIAQGKTLSRATMGPEAENDRVLEPVAAVREKHRQNWHQQVPGESFQ